MTRMTIAALLLSLPFAAHAQQAPNQLPAPARQSQVTATPPEAPVVRLLGLTIRPDASVSPSYSGTAYRTLGGQAETGQDAIVEQVMQSTTADQPQ